MDGDGITLNIFQSNSQSSPTKLKGTKDQRVKKRPGESNEGRTKSSSAGKTFKTEKKWKKSERSADTEHTQSGSRFSSLFNNNPSIPHIPSVAVERTTEDVFSGQTFSELNIHPHMTACLEQRMKITTLTAVQKAAIPHILAGSDVMVKSQTGSGKTLCYAVPVVQQLQAVQPPVQRSHGPYVLVIVPTRELATQTYEAVRVLLQPFQRLVPGTVMGGEPKPREKARLRKGINVLIGTPGRLLDHLQNTQSMQKLHVRHLIIDEADRLLDMGFELEVKNIVTHLEQTQTDARQTLLLSATLSQRVESLAGMSLNNPVRIDIAHASQPEEVRPDDGTFATPEGLKHHLVVVPTKLRLVTLAAFILWKTKYTKKNKKMIIFLATNDSVEFHHKLLQNVICQDDEDPIMYKLCGDMPQKERTEVYKEFSVAESGVLFCTDVAARGLDMPHVRWIVQYNSPGSATDYIHRVGRTARMGSQGHALLFLTPSEVLYVPVLQKQHISLAEMKMDDILKTLLIELHNSGHGAQRRDIHTVQESATALQRQLEDQVQSTTALRTLARKAYQSFVRSYATHSNDVKHIFQVKGLHLGHVAKSFALKDKPTNIGDIVSKTAHKPAHKRKRDFDEGNYGKNAKHGAYHLMSEFSSGINPKAMSSKVAPTKLKNVKKFAGTKHRRTQPQRKHRPHKKP